MDAVGLGQRGQAGGQRVEQALGLAFGIGVLGTLDLFPGLELLVQIVEGHVTEHMGMTAHHLGPVVVQGVVQTELAALLVQMGHEEQQEGHVAQFFAHVGRVAGADGADQLVALLDEVFGQAFGGLLLVPGAAVLGIGQPFDDGLQFFQSAFHETVPCGGLKSETADEVRRQPAAHLAYQGIEVGQGARMAQELGIAEELL